MTDAEIIALIQKSPPLGHRALFDEYYSYVYAISVNVLRGYGSAEDVEECVIDAFASVIKRLEENSTAAVKPFLGTVAKNRAISMRRSLAARNGRSISVESEELGELSSDELVDRNAEERAMTELLLRRIKELGEPDSGIIIQKYFYEQNANEIGRMMNMKPATVRMRCARAMKKLRGLLSDFR